MIKIKGLRREYGDGDARVTALRDISLHIAKNEFVAVMGSSGSGKSTLMNILGCLDQQTAGHYWLDGREVSSFDDESLSAIRNRQIGFIFQTFHLLPRLTARQNVMLPLRFADASASESGAASNASARAVEMLKRVGLEHRIDHRPFEMSGGQRQRVAIARALINRPKVIFADEPTGNLDSKTSEEILELLCMLHEQGQTIVMVTHEQEVASRAQRIIRMSDGAVVEDSKCSA